MRKLASIQKIVALEKIEGADAIEKATVLGWQVVVKKDEFKTGELIVYCEIDSILPEKPEFEFLRERKFRIKTIKLRGQVSQGICFPLSVLPDGNYNENDDVTGILGVTKHDPQAIAEKKYFESKVKTPFNRVDKFLRRYAWYRRLIFKPDKLPFPPFIKKTDEDRVQLFPDICESEKGTVFQVTEKIDGQSASYFVIRNQSFSRFWKPYIFGVCSRNFQLIQKDRSSYWSIAEKLYVKKQMTKFCKMTGNDLVIQGEIIGPKIQCNKYKINENDFMVFIAYVPGEGIYNYDNIRLKSLCDSLHLKTVPLLETTYILPDTIEEIVKYATGKSTMCDMVREGIVIRNYEKKISFKVINPDFLLKYNE